MTNRRETFVVGRIDRRRERAEVTAERAARWKALAARASSLVASEASELPEEDRAAFVTALAAAVRAQLVLHHGQVGAASILSREAAAAGRDILPRTMAVREAAALVQRPANDDGGAND